MPTSTDFMPGFGTRWDLRPPASANPTVPAALPRRRRHSRSHGNSDALRQQQAAGRAARGACQESPFDTAGRGGTDMWGETIPCGRRGEGGVVKAMGDCAAKAGCVLPAASTPPQRGSLITQCNSVTSNCWCAFWTAHGAFVLAFKHTLSCRENLLYIGT